MDWQTIIGLLGAFGLGSIFTSVLTHLLAINKEKSTRTFEEKKNAYLGLAEALHLSDIKPTAENAKNYGLWHIKVSLVGSPSAIKYSQLVIDTSPNSSERRKALDNLIESMRIDLNIDTRKI